MKILFDAEELYYFSVYNPVIKECLKREISVHIGVYEDADEVLLELHLIDDIKVHLFKSRDEAYNFYRESTFDWIVFGNGNEEQVFKKSLNTVYIGHGISPKQCYYDDSNYDLSIRFVESEYRKNKLQQLYPEKTFINVGYAKLDSIVNKEFHLKRVFDLDPNKKTILFAPSYFPSSLENFSTNFPEDFKNFNIIIKAHNFSWTKKKYKKHRLLFRSWSQFENVFLVEKEVYDICPFYLMSDTLLSDTSSVMYEFAALSKPTIWCNFIKWRWTYNGLLKYRRKSRLSEDIKFSKDVGYEAKSYTELLNIIPLALKKGAKENSALEKFIMKPDGLASTRIVDYFLK